MRARRAGRRLDDAGGAELFVLVSVMVSIAALGLVVDGGGVLRTKDQAAWCAQQAARAAGQKIDLAQAAAGQAPVVTGPDAVHTAAEQVAAVSGLTGTARLNADGTVTASCTGQYRPVVYTVAGFTTWSTTAEATARPVRGISEEWP